MAYLLDTNTVVARLNGDTRVAQRLANLRPGDVLLCAPVVAELVYGARLSAKAVENMGRVEHLTDAFGVLPFGDAAARIFGRLKSDLRRRGLAKSDFDLAIASIALERTAVLVTADHAFHDGSIADLQVEDWQA